MTGSLRKSFVLSAVVVLAAIAAVLVVVLGHGSSAVGSSSATPDAYGVRNENVQQVQHLIARGALVLDVRTDKEWSAGHLAGSVHIPLAQVQSRAAELPKGRTIVAVCHTGARSYKAVYALDHLGYDAVNLAGGLNAWVAAKLPVVDANGGRGRILGAHASESLAPRQHS